MSGRREVAREALPRLFRTVRAIIIVLMAIDIGALWLLLWQAGVAHWPAFVLALWVGGLTSYRAQFQHLLSAREFRRHGSPRKLLLTALVLLVLNASAFYLVTLGMFFSYLAARLTIAALVLWAWGRREAPRALSRAWRRLRPPPPSSD